MRVLGPEPGSSVRTAITGEPSLQFLDITVFLRARFTLVQAVLKLDSPPVSASQVL